MAAPKLRFIKFHSYDLSRHFTPAVLRDVFLIGTDGCASTALDASLSVMLSNSSARSSSSPSSSSDATESASSDSLSESLSYPCGHNSGRSSSSSWSHASISSAVGIDSWFPGGQWVGVITSSVVSFPTTSPLIMTSACVIPLSPANSFMMLTIN